METRRRILLFSLLAAIIQLTNVAGYPSSSTTVSNAGRQDPGRLATVAISISLTKAKQMANYVSNLSRQADHDSDQAAITVAVHDCVSVFTDVVDKIHGSLKQMRRLRGSGESLRFQLSNVQTWMSAALTDEETCTDGFEDVPEGRIKSDVCDRAGKVKEVTSNALALINSYVNKLFGS